MASPPVRFNIERAFCLNSFNEGYTSLKEPTKNSAAPEVTFEKSPPHHRKKKEDVLKAATQVVEEGDETDSDNEFSGDEPIKVSRDRKSR